MNEKQRDEKSPLATLLNEAKGKQVKVWLTDGEILRGALKNFSLYEIELDNVHSSTIVWKQSLKYLEIK